MRLLPPIRLRLGEPDWERYGDQWWTFDEADLTRMPARQLVEIERELKGALGLTILGAMASYRAGEITGTLALLWLARRMSGVVEPLAEFEPLVMLADAELLDGGDADPPASTSSASPTSEEG
ncbi:MAG TPA: hypothetical protein VF174_07320 [Micromonosporaceae bacterium]